MKTNLIITISAALVLSPAAIAEHHKGGEHKDDHKAHDHDSMAGPNGGKVVHEVDPHAELFVTKDRKIQITFLDDDGKAAAPGEQVITVFCGKRSAPTRMKFEKGEKAFLSDKALPAGSNIPTVVQIKMKPDAKSELIRLNLNLEDCPTCDYLEYACVCDHGEEDDDHKDHAHDKDHDKHKHEKK